MNMKKLTLGLIGSLIIISGLILADFSVKEENMYVPRNNNEEVFETSINGAASWQAKRRNNLLTGTIDIRDIETAMEQIALLKKQKNGMDLEWEDMGPSNIGGRCRALLIDKNDPTVMYAGGISGGLWKSTTSGNSWSQIRYDGDDETNNVPNLNISSIGQDVDGNIYFGTGEGFYIGYGTGARGFQGAGIWKSTDGETFSRIESTWSTSDSKLTFVYVNKIIAHPTVANKIFVASARGLQVSSNGGNTWENPVLNVANMPITEFCGDVRVGPEGNVVIVDLGISAYVSHSGGTEGSFEKITGSGEGDLPTSSRTEFAIAPTDPNIIYAQCANNNGTLKNIYRSTDKGLTWSIIGPGGSADFNVLGNQGTYDNVIAVFPDDADAIMVGGQYALWSWSLTESWNKLTYWQIDPTDLQYVHADQHAIEFHPTNPDIVYCGSDGGIHRSLNRGMTWQTRNKYFNVTQFYNIAHSPTNELIGGTQDNGTLYMDPDISVSTGTSHEYYEVSGGDGGYSEISQINPNIIFSTVYYSSVYRSDEKGAEGTALAFYSSRLINTVEGIGEDGFGHPFVTPIALWESFYDENSIDSVYKVAPRDYEAGEIIDIESNITEKSFYVTLDDALAEDDTVYTLDTYQSLFSVGFGGSIWVTRDALSMRTEPDWVPVVEFDGQEPNTMEWSSDGDILYIATTAGGTSNLYRVKGFIENRLDSLMDVTRESYNLEADKIASFSNRTITGIGVDPEVSGNVVLTLGNYGSSQFVYYSTSANTAPAVTSGAGEFSTKQGNLPAMPVYDAIVLWNDSRKVIVGTEFGVYSTNDITVSSPVWNDENDEVFDQVPVYSLSQQTHRNDWIDEINQPSGVINHGYIYAGTHGRGIFLCTQFAGPASIEDNTAESALANNLIIFPNPAADNTNFNIRLNSKENVQISIYDLQGKLVDVVNYTNLPLGRTSVEYNCSSLQAGMYVVTMKAGTEVETSKLIVK